MSKFYSQLPLLGSRLFLFSLYMGVNLFSSILYSPSAQAENYILSTYDVVPGRFILSTSLQLLDCGSVLEGRPAKFKVNVSRTANISKESDWTFSEKYRGQQIHQRNLSEFDRLTDSATSRIFSDWRSKHGFSDPEMNSIFQLHRSLDRSRTRIVTVESTDGTLFSSLRIYDSSPTMKSYGLDFDSLESEAFAKDVSEMVFPNLNLTQALYEAGVTRSYYTWSLGLLDISGPQENAALVQFAQAADLLDLHYNGRSYLAFSETDIIEKNDVDVIFYAREGLRSYYRKKLGLEPLKGLNGQYQTYSPQSEAGSQSQFHIYQIKGSEFLHKFLGPDFHEPLFAWNREIRNQVELRKKITQFLKETRSQLPIELYKANNYPQLLGQLKAIALDYIQDVNASKENALWAAVVKLIYLRRSLPNHIFEEGHSEAHRRALQTVLAGPLTDLAFEFQRIMRTNAPPEARQFADAVYFPILAWGDMLLKDPVSFVLNRTNLK